MSSAWTFQDPKQVEKLGADKASWYVGWYDPAGKRCSKSYGPGELGREKAEKRRIILEDQLTSGRYEASNLKKHWRDFRQEYESKVLVKLAYRSQEEVKAALDHFERLAKPGKMAMIRTKTIDDFTAKRRKEKGKVPGSTVSPATVNKDLRHVRAALRKAARWGYLQTVPAFDMEREPEKLVTYVTPEHFAAIYAACDKAELPADLPYPAADWWKALVVFIYLSTGWRIGQTLALKREDLDLDKMTAMSRYTDNKGKRDVQVPLHPITMDHLKRLASFSAFVFPWTADKSTLYTEFARIQGEAAIKLVCREKHKCTDACHVYGFHDLRRAFATLNAERLTEGQLQTLMQHRSYSTTKRYINMAKQMNTAVAALHVPEVLRTAHL